MNLNAFHKRLSYIGKILPLWEQRKDLRIKSKFFTPPKQSKTKQQKSKISPVSKFTLSDDILSRMEHHCRATDQFRPPVQRSHFPPGRIVFARVDLCRNCGNKLTIGSTLPKLDMPLENIFFFKFVIISIFYLFVASLIFFFYSTFWRTFGAFRSWPCLGTTFARFCAWWPGGPFDGNCASFQEAFLDVLPVSQATVTWRTFASSLLLPSGAWSRTCRPFAPSKKIVHIS